MINVQDNIDTIELKTSVGYKDMKAYKAILLIFVIIISTALMGCIATLTLTEKMYKDMNQIEAPKATVSTEGKYHVSGLYKFLDTVYIVGNYCGIKEESNTKYHTYHFLNAYNNLSEDYLEVLFPVIGENVQLRTINKRKHLSECDKMPALLILLDNQHGIYLGNANSVYLNYNELYRKFKSLPLEGIDKQTFTNQIETAQYPFAVELFLYDCKHGDIALVNKEVEEKLNIRYVHIQIPSRICKYRWDSIAYVPLYILTIPIDIVTFPAQIIFLENFRF